MKDLQTWNELTAEVARLERENAELREALPKWIPINERLPDKDEHVLAYTPNSDERNYQVVGGWICHHTWIDITHWMPLPKAPFKLEDKI